MNSMKRILALIVTFMMVFSLAAPVGYALDETENELETSDMQEEPVLQDEGPLEEPVLQDEGPLEEPVPKETEAEPSVTALPKAAAQSGGYAIYVYPQGKGFASYFDMKMTIYNSEGEEIGVYELNKQEYGDPFDDWGTKLVIANLDDPAEIEIKCSYHLEMWDEFEYRNLVYRAPFDEYCDKKTASCVTDGQEVEFALYSIECIEATSPVHYVDAAGNDHIQEEYEIFRGQGLGDGWYVIRGGLFGMPIRAYGNANLIVCDNSSLDLTDRFHNSIWVDPGATLTIWCQKLGNGWISAEGDTPGGEANLSGFPGIDVDKTATLVINGGVIKAKGGRFAAGIGSGYGQKSGTIIINGGTVTAIGGGSDEDIHFWQEFDVPLRYAGAGIGGGAGCESGPIIINGGSVNAKGGNNTSSYGAPGIGAGGGATSGPITINGGKVIAEGTNYGAGIGGGPRGKSGPITINDGYVEATSTFGAGIGSGGWCDVENGDNSNGVITINGGTVKASSGSTDSKYTGSGAAIGAGLKSAQGEPIYIYGGDVTAVVTMRSAAIGGSADDSNGYAGGLIEIRGSNTKVTAISVSGAAIGSGGRNVGANSVAASGASGGHVIIEGATVLAVSTGAGAGIGGGNGGGGGLIEIYDGSHVTAMGGFSKYSWKDESSGSQGGTTISNVLDPVFDIIGGMANDMVADAILEALFGDTFAASGMGGGSHASGGEVHIYGGIVEVIGGNNDVQAIGHGRSNGTTGTLTVYDNAKVTYGKWANDDISVLGVATGLDKHTYAQKYSYAKIEPGNITVTFDVDDKCTAPDPQTIQAGTCATKPQDDPEAEGFLFGGWYADEECTEIYDFMKPVYASTTIYARWIPLRTVEIHKDWSGAKNSDIPSSLTVTYWVDNVANDDISEETHGDACTLVLNEENNWTGSMPVSDEGILTVMEETIPDYRLAGYTFGENISLPVNNNQIVLNLRDPGETGLTQDEFDEVAASVKAGEGSITITNVHQRVYSVKKVWVLPEGQEKYRPESVTFVLEHRENGEWKTERTVNLTGSSEQNEWSGSFEAVDDDLKAPFEDWRIRELDKNGEVIPDSTDEGGSETPTGVLTAQPYTDTSVDLEYQVSYENDSDALLSTVTNRVDGKVYSVTMNWLDFKGDEDTVRPEGVDVELFGWENGETYSLSGQIYMHLSEENGWQAAFPGRTTEGDYLVLELVEDGDGQKEIDVTYNEDTGTWEGEASYLAEDNGITVRYQYDVTVELDQENNSYTITNKRVGVIYSVTKEWDVPEGSPWPERIYSIYPVLQHRTVDENGNETWVNVEEQGSDFSPSSVDFAIQWHRSFEAIPIDDNFRNEDYRVREFMRHDPDYPSAFWSTRTYFDPEEGIGTFGSLTGRIILAEDDADNTDNIKPVFFAENRSQGVVSTSFNVTYSRDDNGNFIITNHQAGMMNVEKEWASDSENTPKPDQIMVVLQKKTVSSGEEATWDTVEEAVLNDENSWKYAFDAAKYCQGEEFDESDFRIREMADGKVIPAPSDQDQDEDSTSEFSCTVNVDGKDLKLTYAAEYKEDVFSTIIKNTLKPGHIYVEKKWDIDLEKKDHPDNIQVALQKKSDDKWKTVDVAELGKGEDGSFRWKAEFSIPATSKDEYRVRELRAETLLEELIKSVREKVSSSATYDEIIGLIKGSEYYQALPESIRNAADQGQESLSAALGANAGNLFDKLLKQLEIASANDRIVYDKEDQDKPSGDGESQPETNLVTYHVGSYQSLLSGEEESAHETKYQVSYASSVEDGETTFTITNKAILNIDVVKRWISFGVDDEDMPDSVWLVLMCKPKAGALENAQNIPGVGEITGILDYEFPVINPIKGGIDPLNLISQLSIGVDMGKIGELFSKVLPTLAIAKTDEESDWTVNFTVSKYNKGIPMEYKGAELSSEVIRQVIKYLSQGTLDLPVSYNPFDGYFSIPTKAVCTFMGVTKLEDIMDISGLAGKALDKAKTLGAEDIADFGWQTFEDETHLLANVINVKIDWDDEESDTLSGSKTWVGDTEDKRPDTLKIHIKDGDEEIEGSPVELHKSDFEGEDVWTWELDLEEEPEDPTYVVTEEYPEGFADQEHYVMTSDELDITNTWNEDVPETVNISGRKIWKDMDDRDGIRPKSVTVRLMANGEEAATVEVSETGGWKYFFPEYPRKDEDGQDIEYTVEEVTDEVITGEDGPGTYAYSVDGYNIINTHTPETVKVAGIKSWDDEGDRDGVRPESITLKLMADGEKVDSITVSEGSDGLWAWSFAEQPKYAEGGTREIEYQVVEELTDVINGTDGRNSYFITSYISNGAFFRIINKHTHNTIDVSGAKTWVDEDDKDGLRPDSITVHLMGDGHEIATKTVTEEDQWKWTFSGVPEYRAGQSGQKIVYTVTEDAVPGYTSETSGMDITNTHLPNTYEIAGIKVWNDCDDRDGLRPDSITVNLMADGEKVDSVVVTSEDADEEGVWHWTFGERPRFAEGETEEPIEYTVTEELTDVITGRDGYNTYGVRIEGEPEEGITITNTHTPNTIVISGAKTWNDENDKDGLRPGSITVHLMGDGHEIATKTVTEEDQWKWTFSGVPEYRADQSGQKIVYSLTEDAVEGYETEIDGFNVTNTHKPETRYYTITYKLNGGSFNGST
ncbi:MAG: Cna B-type domain-containing protein, partial [Anaerovoracaceae bacterium]|nr:Cna B-type domain-containing protein [Anaerovoracaceae bacterium]